MQVIFRLDCFISIITTILCTKYYRHGRILSDERVVSSLWIIIIFSHYSFWIKKLFVHLPNEIEGELVLLYYLPPNNFPITGTLASGFAVLLDCCWLAAVWLVLLPPAADDEPGVWLVGVGAVCGCFAVVVALVEVTLIGVLVWLIIVVVAFPVGVTVVLLLTAGNFALLPGGDSFVCLPLGRGTLPTGSVFFWMVAVVWLAGVLGWLIILLLAFQMVLQLLLFDFFVQILQLKLQK